MLKPIVQHDNFRRKDRHGVMSNAQAIRSDKNRNPCGMRCQYKRLIPCGFGKRKHLLPIRDDSNGLIREASIATAREHRTKSSFCEAPCETRRNRRLSRSANRHPAHAHHRTCGTSSSSSCSHASAAPPASSEAVERRRQHAKESQKPPCSALLSRA